MRYSLRSTHFLLVLFCSVITLCAQSILVDSYTERAKRAFESGDTSAAEKLFKAALVEAEKLEDLELIASCSVNLGKVYHDAESYDLAEPLYIKAIGIFDRLDGKDSERASFAMNNLGLLYAEQKKFEKSEDVLRKTLAIRERLFGSDDPDVAVTLLNLGKLYADQKKYVEADAVYVRSLQILIQHPNLVEEILTCLHNLALATKEINNPNRSEAAYKMAIAIIERNFGARSSRLREPLTGYAKLLRSRMRLREATTIENRIRLLR